MERPFVYLNMAMTADGKITSARREVPRFTSARDKKTMDRLRAEADALLVGAETLRADNPNLGVRDASMRDYRRRLGKTRGLLYVVVSRSLRLDPALRCFRDPASAGCLVATVEDAPEEAESRLHEVAEVVRMGRGDVDLARLMEHLHARGVRRLLAEGGGELNWALARADLLDEIYLTVAPCLLGGREAPTWLEGEGWSMDQRRRLELLGHEAHEGELFLHYRVQR